MEEIRKKINENGIVYEGDNVWLREKKLRQVTNEYNKKYTIDLTELSNVDINLASILNYVQGFYIQIDN